MSQLSSLPSANAATLTCACQTALSTCGGVNVPVLEQRETLCDFRGSGGGVGRFRVMEEETENSTHAERTSAYRRAERVRDWSATTRGSGGTLRLT